MRPASSRPVVCQCHRHSFLERSVWHRRGGSHAARSSRRADARRWLRRTVGDSEGALMTAAGDPTSLAGAIWRLKSDPASTVIRPCPTPARSTARCDVEAATFDQGGSPPITCITVPTCRAHTPMDWNGRMCRLLPRPRGLPRYSGGSASMTSLSRPAQASLALRPAGLLNRPRRPLSRGSDPDDCSSKPLVSYQTNRQLSGWNLPPLVMHAFGAH